MPKPQLLNVHKLFPRVLKSFDSVEKFQKRCADISFLSGSFRQPAQRLKPGLRMFLQGFHKSGAGSEIGKTTLEGIDDLF